MTFYIIAGYLTKMWRFSSFLIIPDLKALFEMVILVYSGGDLGMFSYLQYLLLITFVNIWMYPPVQEKLQV